MSCTVCKKGPLKGEKERKKEEQREKCWNWAQFRLSETSACFFSFFSLIKVYSVFTKKPLHTFSKQDSTLHKHAQGKMSTHSYTRSFPKHYSTVLPHNFNIYYSKLYYHTALTHHHASIIPRLL